MADGIEKRIRVAVVGASGYTGIELTRLLWSHPHIEIQMLCAQRHADQNPHEVNQALSGLDLPKLVKFDAQKIAETCDAAFLCLPHKTAQEATHELLIRGVRVIDLSADHRFQDSDEYERVYGPHLHPDNCSISVYGCPELNRELISTARLVGAPGCYPTSVILGVFAALEADVLASTRVIADCKSGVTGAGRNPGASTHFPETSDGITAYKTLDHRHAPEMEFILGRNIQVEFVPHLVPMNRGILSTVYMELVPGLNLEQVHQLYVARFESEPFVTVLPIGVHPNPRHVRGTNRCHLGVFVNGQRLVVQSAIDNLGKGAAGQALQCFNLMMGLKETTGLDQIAMFP